MRSIYYMLKCETLFPTNYAVIHSWPWPGWPCGRWTVSLDSRKKPPGFFGLNITKQ